MSQGTDLSFDAAIRFAADLIRIPSPSGGEEAVAHRVVEEMRRLGYDDTWTDELGNAVGVIRGRGETAPVLLSCHLDVVDAGDPAAWVHPPYGGVVADGALHGRGAMDIKGPLALQTYAAAALAGDPPPGDVVVAHTTYEERGGWGMAHLLASAAVPRPGAVIIGESTGGDICIGHRGRAELEVEIRGTAGHASAPERARNALDGVGPILDAVAALADELRAAPDPILGAETIVATDVSATPASRNVVPDTVVIALDWRVLPGPTAAEAIDRFRHFVGDRARLPDGLEWSARWASERQRSWTGRECDWEMYGPGFLLEPDHPVPVAAADAVARATGRRPEIRPWRFATDGRHTAAEHGIATIGYAPGLESDAHTNRERLELEPARAAYTAYPGVIRAIFAAIHDGDDAATG